MATQKKASRSDQASIKYSWVPLDVATFDLSDTAQQEDVSKNTESYKQSCKQFESKSPEILSTAELVLAGGRLWNFAVRPLPVSRSEEEFQYNEIFCEKDDELCYCPRERNRKSYTTDGQHSCIDLKSDKVNANSECKEETRKTSLVDSSHSLGEQSFFWRHLQLGDYGMPVESWKVNWLEKVRMSYDLEKVYETIIRKPFLELKCPVDSTHTECQKAYETSCRSGRKSDFENSLTKVVNYSTTDIVNKFEDPPTNKNVEIAENENPSVTSLCPQYILGPITNLKALGAIPKESSSILRSDHHVDFLDLCNACRQFQDKPPEDTTIPEITKGQAIKLVAEDILATELCAVARGKPNHDLPGQRHAFAGALSGTFVSLCLHPIDTIKTVIQSGSMNEKSISDVARSIISERGVFGLYRGIASNIASSAPISAVYTYTYESVKRSLLPLLPKEYHSIAHCTAGGCASIATSFIFTPSERVKQQMQVASNYQNCWTALVGILQKGGLPSLYAGWGAVLCRNIPHSIIKFYTYETLKQQVMSSAQTQACPSTVLTLFCGGMAGSTAALFTTPFDVVKTRLQTQIPGSLSRYDGVFHALLDISKQEGLKGLYRGLAPRLVMYVSQGAIFFASYEFFKTIFSLELPQLSLPVIQNKQNMEDELSSLTGSPSA